MLIPGFDKAKALAHARSVAHEVDYQWHEDPTDDPFAEPPGKAADNSVVGFTEDRL